MKPRVGISTCLLGQRIRYDGGHKRDRWIVEVLSRRVTFVPVCPEVELGMGVPREPIRLEGSGRRVRLVAIESRTDYTTPMRRFAEERIRALGKLDLSGYILKADSPSCGMERVPVHGRASRPGRGAFAAVLMDRLPELPVEDEGRLRHPAVRERFLLRVFALHRLRRFFAGRWTASGLARFQSRERAVVERFRPRARRELERASSCPRAEIAAAYTAAFMRALAKF